MRTCRLTSEPSIRGNRQQRGTGIGRQATDKTPTDARNGPDSAIRPAYGRKKPVCIPAALTIRLTAE